MKENGPLINFIEGELARAEAIIEASKGSFKVYQPVLDNHIGQSIAYRKILALLGEPSAFIVYNREDLLEWYVNARSDGWTCQKAMPKGNNWEHAFLRKTPLRAEINMEKGRLSVWLQNGKTIDEVMPYEVLKSYF